MAASHSNNVAEGYRQASLSAQKLDGLSLIHEDVCPQRGDVILDLGCGTGELSAYLAELVGPEGTVIGVDPDKERIQLARQTHGQIRNLSFVEGRASNLPEVSGSMPYDVIFSNYALHWIPDKRLFFKNVFTCLKEGGRIALHYNDDLYPFESNAFMILNPENCERISQMFHCEPKPDIDRYCSSAGFHIIKSYDSRAELAFESAESLLKWLWSSTHGVFDLSLVTEERLQRYLALYNGKDGTPCLDFHGIKEESTVFRLVAVKPLNKQ